MEDKHAKIVVEFVWFSDYTTKKPSVVDAQLAFCSTLVAKFSPQMFFSSLWQPK